MVLVDGDKALLRRLISLFLVDCPKRMCEIRAAIGCGDRQRLMEAAHTLKGGVGMFGASAVAKAAAGLEVMGREGEMAHAEEMLGALEAALARLTPALAQCVKEGEV